MAEKKKLLVLAHLYAPDVASTASLYQQLCESFAKTYNVTVLCVSPCYAMDGKKSSQRKSVLRETVNDVHLIRIRVPAYNRSSKSSRIKHLLTYFFKGIGQIIHLGRHDVVLTLAQPPIVAGLLGIISKWITHGKLVYNIQDFNPEQIEVTGYSNNKLLLNILKGIDNYTCRHSDHVIIISEDMEKTLIQRLKGKKIPPHSVISNWADTINVSPVARKDNILIKEWDLDPNKFFVVYAGNYGLLQNLSTVINAAEQLKEINDIQFIMIGAGAEEGKLRNMVKEKELTNVIFKPYRPMEEIKYVYSLGDVELVSIGKDVTTCSMPSKTWNILACGRPLVCQVEQKTGLEKLINYNRVGKSIEINDSKLLANTIFMFYKNKSLYKEMAQNARKLAEDQFNANKSISQYQKVIKKVINN